MPFKQKIFIICMIALGCNSFVISMELFPKPHEQKSLLESVQDFFYEHFSVRLSSQCAQLPSDIINKVVPIAYDKDIKFRIDILDMLSGIIDTYAWPKIQEKEYVEWLYGQLLGIYFPPHRHSMLDSKELTLIAASKNKRITTYFSEYLAKNTPFIQHVLDVNTHLQSPAENVPATLAAIRARLYAGNSTYALQSALSLEDTPDELEGTLAVGKAFQETFAEYNKRMAQMSDNQQEFQKLCIAHEKTQKDVVTVQELAKRSPVGLGLVEVLEKQKKLEEQDKQFSELLNQAYQNKRNLPSLAYLNTLKEQLLLKKTEHEAELKKRNAEKEDIKERISGTQKHLKECYRMVEHWRKHEEDLTTLYDLLSREEQQSKASYERVSNYLDDLKKFEALKGSLTERKS